MEVSTISGLGLGLIILALALLLGHVPPETLLNPEALLIVFGGTITATMVSFNQATLMNALTAALHSTAPVRSRYRHNPHRK